MLFAFTGTDKPGVLQQRIDARPAHVAFLEKPADPAVVEAFGFRHANDRIGLGPPETGDLYLCYETSSFDSPVNKVLAKLDGVATRADLLNQMSVIAPECVFVNVVERGGLLNADFFPQS